MNFSRYSCNLDAVDEPMLAAWSNKKSSASSSRVRGGGAVNHECTADAPVYVATKVAAVVAALAIVGQAKLKPALAPDENAHHPTLPTPLATLLARVLKAKSPVGTNAPDIASALATNPGHIYCATTFYRADVRTERVRPRKQGMARTHPRLRQGSQRGRGVQARRNSSRARRRRIGIKRRGCEL